MKRLWISASVKREITWVEYGVILDEDWWQMEGSAELQIKWGQN